MLALAAAFLTSTAQADVKPPKPLKASAMVVFVRVANYSDTCAWVTVYWGRITAPWTIAADGNNRPRFVHVGGFYDFPVTFMNPLEVPIPAEIKVRAEFTHNRDCSGGTKADRENYNKGILADSGTLGLRATVGSQLNTYNNYSVSKPVH